MQFNTIAATLLAAAGLASAAPTGSKPTTESYPSVSVSFWAAADNTFFQPIPIDGKKHDVHSNLSFTYITAYVPEGVTCVAYGIDHSVTTLNGAAIKVPIGPPQQQTSVRCSHHPY